ncbi:MULTISPECIES: hypothetical protein [unclassified Bradyrhizobium]|uniref:hypothetical protein n=1 Tax=unclassified Bradyrhizobium TaxID=2631580 RepID=UPI001FF8F3C0|nr:MULTISPECIES: hypothetical protein [unclassified Bradyrhizobium]
MDNSHNRWRRVGNIARLRAAGGSKNLVDGKVRLMEPRSPLLVPHERKEAKPRLREPLDDCRFSFARDSCIDAAVDDEVPMRLEAGGVENGEVELRGLGHLFVGIVKDVDVVGSSLPILVEHQAAGEIATLRAVFRQESKDVALQLAKSHLDPRAR